MSLRHAYLIVLAACTGCSLLPECTHQPTLHNPFPQLTKVAVVPFFNHSTEPTTDGRRFALGYANELQLVPGYEVVPVPTVERVIRETKNPLEGPDDARRLAQQLGVDAVVIGVVTDYTPYYPPRCGLQVEWYSANPGFHAIPPGYGLPWGTPGEQDIPGDLTFQAEMALAREQMKTQAPAYQPLPARQEQTPAQAPAEPPADDGASLHRAPGSGALRSAAEPNRDHAVRTISHEEPLDASRGASGRSRDGQSGPAAAGKLTAAVATDPRQPGFPENWPDPAGFIPPPPRVRPPTCWPTDGPVMRHTQTYNGNDTRFTEALSSYYLSQDDARFGGWQNYLLRSDDFIRFCCRMHIWEMLSARGGAGPTKVVWRWPTFR